MPSEEKKEQAPVAESAKEEYKIEKVVKAEDATKEESAVKKPETKQR